MIGTSGDREKEKKLGAKVSMEPNCGLGGDAAGNTRDLCVGRNQVRGNLHNSFTGEVRK